jgi:cytoskeletal protein RodZ
MVKVLHVEGAVDEQAADSATWERIGAQLRAARERRGLSLHDIGARTRIKDTMLDAIERGEIEKLPRGPFRRGFARAFAIEVGLDPEVLFADFRPAPAVIAEQPQVTAVEPRLTSGTVLGRLVLGGTVIAAALMMPRWLAPPDAPVAAQDPEIVQAVATTGVQPADGPTLAATASRTQPQGAPVTFALRTTDEVWLEATADGERVAYDLLPPGSERTLVAHKALTIRVGNAGAMEYTINGVAGKPLGAPGDIRDLHLTPENLTTVR